MIELLRTNDIVLLSYVESLLRGEDIGVLVMDSHMSIMEGSIGAIPRRLLVLAEDEDDARRIMREAGLGAHLSESSGERAGV